MKSEKGSLMLAIVVCAVLGIAGGYWLHRSFQVQGEVSEEPKAQLFQESATASAATPTQPEVTDLAPVRPTAVETVAAKPVGADALAEAQLAAVLGQQNRTDDAKEHYREAVRLYQEGLKLKPDAPQLLNNLAWLLSVNPYPEIRDGKGAVEMAKQACEATEWRVAATVQTLAAAYAEAGQFDQAVKTSQRARNIALANGAADVASNNEKLAKLYEEKKAHHESY